MFFLGQNILPRNTMRLENGKNSKTNKKHTKNLRTLKDHPKDNKRKIQITAADYNYELMEFEYYNSRKNVVRK